MSRDHDEGVSWGNESSSSTGMMPEVSLYKNFKKYL